MSATWFAAFFVLTVVVVVNTVLLVALTRQMGVLSLRVKPVGAMEGDGETGPIAGSMLADQQLELASGPADPGPLSAPLSLLLFFSPTCGVCKDLLGPAARIQNDFPEIPVYLVSDVSRERAREYADRMRTHLRVWVAPDLFAAWGIAGTPFAAVVASDRSIVRSGVANTLEHLEVLVDNALSDSSKEAEEEHLLTIERGRVDAST